MSRVYCNTIEVDFWFNYGLIQSDTKYGDDIWSSLKQASEASTKYTIECMNLIEVYRYIVDTVVDVADQGAVLPLSLVGLQPETFWMLQDSAHRRILHTVKSLDD